MKRKEWLEKFLRLVYEDAAMVDYRRELRLKPPAVKSHLNKIPQYEKELEAILAAEEAKEKERVRKLRKSRRKASEKSSRSTSGDYDEALGPRKNRSEDG